MAEIKISALGSAAALLGDEAVPIVQSGVTKRASTSAIAGLLQPALNVVAQALSVEQDARNADVTRLSNQLSNIISAGGGAVSVTSNEVSQVSAVANLHANAISLNLDTEIADRKSAISSPSAKTSLGASVHGLQSVFNALSDRIAGVAAGAVSVTSTELSAAAAFLSNRVSIASAVASTAELHASTASDAATSANVHANNASAAATSVDSRATSLEVRLSTLSASHQALSATVAALGGGGASVTSNEMSLAVNRPSVLNTAAASVHGLQNVFNAISNRISAIIAGTVSVTSQEVSVAAAAADAHASTASLAATSVLNYICAISARTTAGASVKGLQSIVQALSTHINQVSVAAAAGASTTSAEVVSAINNASAKTTGGLSIHGLQSVYNALSSRIDAVGGGAGSVTSNEASAISAQANSAINVVSAALVVETNNRLSADNVLSFRLSVVSNALSVETARALSAEKAFSDLLSVAALNTASALSTMSDQISIAKAALSNLTSAHNVLSNRVSANSATGGGGAGSVTSQNFSVTNAALSNLTSAHNNLSNIVSNALSAGDALSAGLGAPQLRMLSGGIATISATALTKISGLSISVATNGVYQIKGVLLHTHSAPQGFGFGVSGPAATAAGGVWRGNVSIAAAGAITQNYGAFNQAGFGSVTYSAVAAASATMYRTELDLLAVSCTAGTYQLKAKASAAGTGAIHIQVGSYVQAFKIR